MDHTADLKTLVVIDGHNFNSTVKSLGFQVDFKRLKKKLEDTTTLLRINYYTMIDDTEEFVTLRPLVDWLDYNGYNVRTKSFREFTDKNSGEKRLRGNMDVEMATETLDMADKVEHVIFFSGAHNILPIAQSLKRRGVFVTVVSSIKTPTVACADELRRASTGADAFVELADWESAIAMTERQEKPEKQNRPERGNRNTAE